MSHYLHLYSIYDYRHMFRTLALALYLPLQQKYPGVMGIMVTAIVLPMASYSLSPTDSIFYGICVFTGCPGAVGILLIFRLVMERVSYQDRLQLLHQSTYYLFTEEQSEHTFLYSIEDTVHETLAIIHVSLSLSFITPQTYIGC